MHKIVDMDTFEKEIDEVLGAPEGYQGDIPLAVMSALQDCTVIDLRIPYKLSVDVDVKVPENDSLPQL